MSAEYRVVRAAAICLLFVAGAHCASAAQAPATISDDFETDADRDGIPDGWYNVREGTLASGGVEGPTCYRFKSLLPGRSARASRAFAADGRATEAFIVSVWVKVADVVAGERVGQAPGMQIDLLGEDLRGVARAAFGPWEKLDGKGWTKISKRVDVPPGSRDAIVTVGLLGATGTLDVDGISIEPVAAGGVPSSNLVWNGDLELGDPEPDGWILEGRARRCFPGNGSSAGLELTAADSKAILPLSVPVRRFSLLDIRVDARAAGLRGGGGAVAELYFVDASGRPLPGSDQGIRLFRWSGTFDWKSDHATADVPAHAVNAVLQFTKSERAGTLKIDNLEVTAAPDESQGRWTPWHTENDTERWPAYQPAAAIAPGSALDASRFLDAPAGSRGRVVVRDQHLAFKNGGRARFLGAVILPPLAFPDRARADELAERLARSGVNIARFFDLDAPYGPERSLLDDASDDTSKFDAEALARFHHFIASLKARGIYVSIELQGARRFRAGDGIPDARKLPPGGGPAAAFEPAIRERAFRSAKLLLDSINPETKLALKDDPVLAWVVLSGELTLFDLDEADSELPPKSLEKLRAMQKSGAFGSGRRALQAIEANQWSTLARELKEAGLKAPIAGCSHWRREAEFTAAQLAPGLDLIDDRLFWSANSFAAAERRSMIWAGADQPALSADASKKRRSDRPYAAGQWCAHTQGAWALPYETADLLIGVRTAVVEDWDALIRRGVFVHPVTWGAAAPGTGGPEDLYCPPDALNANPAVFGFLPHAASLFHHGIARASSARAAATTWDAHNGRLLLNTPFTQGFAGWRGDRPIGLDALRLEIDNPYAAVVVSSADSEPIERSRRLLLSAIARVESTGVRYKDAFQATVGRLGQPPLRLEPLRARVFIKRASPVRVFELDNSGARLGAVSIDSKSDGVLFSIDNSKGTVHWEIVFEPANDQQKR